METKLNGFESAMAILKLILLTSALLIASCKINDAIIDNSTRKRIVGYQNTPLIIRKTKIQDVANMEELKNRGIYLQFDKNQKLRMVYVKNSGYCTNRGVCIGDAMAKVVDNYGVPPEKEIEVRGGGAILAYLSGAFYDRYLFFPDSLGNVKEITFGDHDILQGKKGNTKKD